ncbi:hypothetical protein LuPra_01828 [Luteitalea pratensis]|uniref:Uncharacterized protein n=1 Tax=Luteitalea pratensis TaxID=1855912 RepID=A0A143PLF8_LUTPR|nr:hypothetical protein [Luteitalea pratensis]AMY08624.1 hypothetical protein LuPra_01828 [Luteitalea pratensis]
MPDINTLPEWFGAAVIGGVIAALGYLAKLGVEAWEAWRHRRAERLRQLLELASLLHASYEAFHVQAQLVERLERMLSKTHPDVGPDQSGFERHFTDAFDNFTPDESDLHGFIRSMTKHSIRPLYQAMTEWLHADFTYRTARGADGRRGRLASKLNQLDTHLRLWHAKYEAWIPGHPQHALVYLADEEQHGVGFPRGLDQVVDEVLRELDARVAPNKRLHQTVE